MGKAVQLTTGDIKLDSVMYFTADGYMVSRQGEGNTIVIVSQAGGRSFCFDVARWREIQDLVNAAIAGFEKIKAEEVPY